MDRSEIYNHHVTRGSVVNKPGADSFIADDQDQRSKQNNQSRVTNLDSFHGSPNMMQDVNYNSLSPTQYNQLL